MIAWRPINNARAPLAAITRKNSNRSNSPACIPIVSLAAVGGTSISVVDCAGHEGVLARGVAVAADPGAIRDPGAGQAAALPRDAARAVAEPRALALRVAHPQPRRVRRLLARPA